MNNFNVPNLSVGRTAGYHEIVQRHVGTFIIRTKLKFIGVRVNSLFVFVVDLFLDDHIISINISKIPYLMHNTGQKHP